MKGRVEMAVVDAFTSRPFAGNPAGVCLLDGPADEQWMQAVARELNFSETAFVHAEAPGYRLRWFTPVTEIELCGHATLASAHLLWEEERLATGETARFFTLSGELTATRDPAAPDSIVLDFPAISTSPAAPPSGMLDALGVAEAVFVARSGADFLVQMETAAQIHALQPDFPRLLEVTARTVAVTAPGPARAFTGGDRSPQTRDVDAGAFSEGMADIVTRFFAPRMGAPEDPVTGFAHCMVGPHWQREWGRNEFLAYQASARGGFLRVAVHGDRVRLGGQAVTVVRGRLLGGLSV